MDDAGKKGALTRRHALTGFAAAVAAGLPFGAQAKPTAVARLLADANVCVLTPQAEEGPFYFDPKLERVDITEGRQGVPLGLVMQVVQASDCTPLKGARVDVWHADALGYYSGYRGQSDAHNVSTKGDTFLRGTQFSDANGQVKFTTIYPGWYRGRTTHIHCKLFLDHKTVLTTQLYFPDALSEYIYTKVGPYNTRAHARDTVNTTDHVVENSGSAHASFCSIKEEADRYLASLVVGVDHAAKENARLGPGGPPPGDPPPGGFGPPAESARPKGALVPGVVTSE